MTNAPAINCSKRTDMGKGASRRLRHQAKVPGIIYGPKQDPLAITVELKALRKQLENRAFYTKIIELNLDGQPIKVVLKDIQRHPAKETPLHADFLAIDMENPIRKMVPINFLNEEKCVGVKQKGGLISKQLTEIEVSCLPEYLPEQIDLDMTDVDVGTIIHLTDLKMPEQVTICALTLGEDHNLSVVFVKPPKGESDSGNTEDGDQNPDTAE